MKGLLPAKLSWHNTLLDFIDCSLYWTVSFLPCYMMQYFYLVYEKYFLDRIITLFICYLVNKKKNHDNIEKDFIWFVLYWIKAGSTQVTRLTAARQIGDIAKTHPQDLNSLLKKVCWLHFSIIGDYVAR